ncbi:MAG: hypothetical protein QOI76_4306 [Frankiales bacterium]|nr:hypothetical protein [Frankiales bacterium]
MTVTPLPGVKPDRLLAVLEQVHDHLGNKTGAVTGTSQRFAAYIQWANDSVGLLRKLVGPNDLESLVLTRRYWVLQDKATIDGGPLAYLLNTAIDEQLSLLQEAVNDLRLQIARWSHPGWLVVADTSVYIRHEDKLRDLVFSRILPSRHEPVHLLVPILVVDELDGLKQSKDKHVRWRAGHSLGVIDELQPEADFVGELRPADFSTVDEGGIPSGQVTIQVVLDPPAHSRLPIEDDEIVDRAVAFQTLASRPVTLLTFDTGMSTRARFAGLRVTKLTSDKDDHKGERGLGVASG